MAYTVTYSDVKDKSNAKKYTAQNPSIASIIKQLNDFYSANGEIKLEGMTNQGLVCCKFSTGSSGGKAGLANIGTGIASEYYPTGYYANIEIGTSKLIAHVKVTQVKNITISTPFIYPLVNKTGANWNSNYPYFSDTVVYSLAAWRAAHDTDYIVTGIDFYDNTNDTSISVTNQRTKFTPSNLIYNYDVYQNMSFSSVSRIDGNMIGDGQGDALYPLYRNFIESIVNNGFQDSPSVCQVFINSLQTGACLYAGDAVNTSCGALANNGQCLKTFISLNALTFWLNSIGLPFTYSVTEATSKPTTGFTDFVPSGQPSDTTGGGSGTGNNMNDDIIQNSPSITPVSSFNKCYAMTQYELGILSTYLWTSTFLTDIKLLFNNPAEGIISCKMFPFSLTAHDSNHVGASEALKIGNVTTTAMGCPISSGYNAYFSMGSITIDEYYGSAMDYAPYTTIQIYLPYIGIKDLDPAEVMNRTISITYIVDISTGAIIAELWNGTQLLYTFEGRMGIDIPISSTNAAQFATSMALTALSGASGIIAGVAAENPLIVAGSVLSTAKSVAGNQFHINKAGINSPSAVLYMPQNPYIIFGRPIQSLASTFGATHGFPCNVSKQLSTLTGYTEIESPILNSISATKDELEQIKNLLETGVIFA